MSKVQSEPESSGWMRFMPLLLIPVLVLIAFRFAEPVGDGDLFWQMAYGRYFVQNHTLIPDHSIYSWTPAANTEMYCSWVAELFFYGLHCLGGLPLIFAFRYFVVGGCALLALSYAYKIGWHRRAEFYLMLTVYILAGYVGTIIKPELFSYAFMSIQAWLLFRFRLAVYRRERYLVYLVGLPILSITWLNSHGVHVFGLVASLVFVGGEICNQLLSKGLALPRKAFGHLLLSFGACCLGEFCSPYGWRFPAQLLEHLIALVSGTLPKGQESAYGSIAAHMTIWQTPAFHFHHYLYLMGIVWAILSLTRLIFPPREDAKVDFIYFFLNLSMAYIYTVYLRTTFYWPPFFLFSTLYMIGTQRPLPKEAEEEGTGLTPEDQPVGRRPRSSAPAEEVNLLAPQAWLTALSIVLLLFFAGRGVYESVYQPYASSWCGFGITYWNPVMESEFVAKYHPDADKVYNDYDGGGYLIWSLYPKVKVMIDPRSFPYRDWYSDYIAFERGQLPISFLDRWLPLKADVAIISLKNTTLWRTFLQSPDWVGAWVGQGSIVFCRRGHIYPPDALQFHADRYENVENSQKCLQIFQFLIEARNFQHAFEIIGIMKRKFHTQNDILVTEDLEAYANGLINVQKKDYDAAIVNFEKCRQIGLFYNNSLLLQLYQYKLNEMTKKGVPISSPEAAALMVKIEKAQSGGDPNQ